MPSPREAPGAAGVREEGGERPPVGVVIVAGSCCVPGMAPLEERVREIVQEAAAEAGVAVAVRMMPATTAYLGGIPRPAMARLIGEFNATAPT